MRETANYNFPVPERSDYAKIETIAQTFEKIDVEIKRIDVKVDESEQEVDYVKHPGYGVTTFTSPTYFVTLSPAPTQYVDGMGLVLRLNADQIAGNAAINVNGLGGKNILNSKGFSVTNLKKDAIYSFRYSTAKGAFILQGESEVEIGKQIITPSTTNQTILKGLHDGTGFVVGDVNLIPSNIIKDKSIFGVLGNVDPAKIATGTTTATYADNNRYVMVTISGISFNPKMAILYASRLSALIHTTPECWIPSLSLNVRAGNINEGYGYRNFNYGFTVTFLKDNYQFDVGEYKYILIG